MNDVFSLWLGLSPEMSIRWGLTLLHFLWQGAVIGLLAVGAARLFRDQSATLRYLLHAVALTACPICVAITCSTVEVPEGFRSSLTGMSPPAIEPQITRPTPDLTSLDRPYPQFDGILPAVNTENLETSRTNAATLVEALSQSSVPVAVNAPNEQATNRWLPQTVQWLTVLYAAGAFYFLLRLGIALWGGHRLRAISRPLSDSEVLQLLRNQAERIGLTLVPVVAYCERVAVPTVIGVVRPMILLPATLTTGLSIDEFSAILSHEFAHIRRYDLWMNLLQRVIESLLFFHPVVWFLSRRLSAEREICCDDLVVRSGHEPLHYAGALLRMAELCVGNSAPNSLAIAATTGGRALFEHRVLRLIHASPSTRLHLDRKSLFLLASALLLAIASSMPINRWLSKSSTTDPSNSARVTHESQKPPDETPKKEGETPVEKAAVEEPASTTVTIAGRVELEDGTLVTKPGSIHIRSRSNRSSNSGGGNFEDGRFSEKILAGRISVTAFVEGYGPAWTDEFELNGGGRKENLVIVLTTGAKKTIRVVDEGDRPVAGATLIMHPEIHGEAGGPNIEFPTDDHGLLTVEHLADTLYEFRINAPGFQMLRTGPVSVSGDDELVLVLKRCRPATGWIFNPDGTPATGADLLKCVEVSSKGPNSGASYYSVGTGDAGWFGQRIATTNADGRYELDQLNDESQYMMVIQGADGSRLVLSDLAAGQVDREITLPERRDLVISVTGDTSSLPKRDGKPFVVVRQEEITMRMAKGHGSSASLGADIPLELDANGGSATFQGLIVDQQSDENSAEVAVSLGYGSDLKKTVRIEAESDTKVTFELPPAKSEAAEPKPDEGDKTLGSTDVPIRYPHCVLEIENLLQRPLVEAIASFNRTSQESPTGVRPPPIAELETRDAIAKFAAEKHVLEAVRVQLEEILKSGTLPSNAYFRRFTRFDDGKQMQGVWWVRLVVETPDGPVYSVPVRTTPLFARPYTQMERQQNAADGLTLINRVASYYETAPESVESNTLPQASVDALIRRTQEALKRKDIAACKALFETTGASESLQEFTVSELQQIAQSQVQTMKVRPVKLRGDLLTWSAWQFYKPNLPIVGFLEIEYTNHWRAAGRQPSETTDKTATDTADDDKERARRAAALPLSEETRKTLSLELGFVGDELRLVNYIADGDAKPPGKIDSVSISGHIEPLADGTHLITDVITNPGTLLSAHLANEEIRQRDFRQRTSEDTPRVNNEIFDAAARDLQGPGPQEVSEAASLEIRLDIPGVETNSLISVFNHGRNEYIGTEEPWPGSVRANPIRNGGTLQLKDLVPGEYEIARCRNAAGHGRYLDRRRFQLTGGETKFIDFSRPGAKQVPGRIMNLSDLKLESTLISVLAETARDVKLADWGEFMRQDVLDFRACSADGTFTTDPLAPGNYVILVEGFEPLPPNAAGLGIQRPRYMAKAEITVPESGDAPAAEITLKDMCEDIDWIAYTNGKYALKFIDDLKPAWSRAQEGIEFGVCHVSDQRRFLAGERVPLVMFVRNTGDRILKVSLTADFQSNGPEIRDDQGRLVHLELLDPSTQYSGYHETLKPGEAFGFQHYGLRLGDNPRPKEQNWFNPYWKEPVVGKYTLRQRKEITIEASEDPASKRAEILTTGTIDFEVFEGTKSDFSRDAAESK